MAMTLAKLITTLVMLVILMPMTGVLFSLYTTPNAQGNYTQLASNTSAALRNSVFNPTKTLALNGANVTSNTTGSFFTNSFFYAFIFPNFGQIVYSIIQIPSLFGNMFQVLLSTILGIAPGVPAICPAGVTSGPLCTSFVALVASTFAGIIVMFIALLVVSMWMKYPAWS